jgi:hypothetical protein
MELYFHSPIHSFLQSSKRLMHLTIMSHVLSGFGDGMSLSNSRSFVTFTGSGPDIMGMGMNENRVDYPSSATAATSVLPFALEGVFFKVRCKL